MSKPKRHHYVPVTYLEQWTSAKNGMLMHKHKSGKIYPSKPANVFVEGYLYRVKDIENESLFEDAYSDIEGHYRGSIQPLRSSNHITQDQFEKFSNFMAHQVLRTKASRDLLDKIFETMLKDELKRHEELGLSPSLPLSLLESPNDLSILNEEWKTIYLFKQAESVRQELLKKDWMFVDFPKGRLLTSGNPISFVQENNKLSIAGVGSAKIITYPLSRNRALILSTATKEDDDDGTTIIFRTIEDDDLSNKINVNTTRNAQNGIVWHSDDEKYLGKFI